MMLRKTVVVVAALAAAIATSLTTASVASASPGTPGTFNVVAPTRLLDTRSDIGATQTLGPKQMLSFNATSGIDGLVSAVALTITAVSPTGTGWLTVYPASATAPLASTVNFTPGRTTPNSTILQVGADGMVDVFNGSTGTVDVLADLTGYWSGGALDPAAPVVAGTLTPLPPKRIVDTRDGAGGPRAAKSTLVVPVDGFAGVPAEGVSAVAVNLTVTEAKRSGWLTAGSETPPADAQTSSVNFLPNQSRAALAVVPVAPDGSISVYNGSDGTAQVVADVVGYFNSGADSTPAVDGAYLTSTPFRSVDTRVIGGALPALTTRVLQVLPNDGTALVFKGLTVTVTAVTPQNSGFFTVWDGTTGLPPTSNGNFVRSEDSASTMIVPVNPDGTISVFNGSYGTLNIIVDIDGFVLNDLTSIPTVRAAVTKNKTAAAASLTKSAIARTRAFAASHH